MIAIFLLTIFFIVMTGTRSALVIMAIGIIILGIYQKKFSKILRMSLLLGIVVFSLGVYNYYSRGISTGMIIDRYSTLFDAYSNEEPNVVMLIIGLREEAWWNTIKEIKNRPLVGHGPVRSTNIGALKTDPHSLYFDLLYKFGILGFIAFAAFFIKILKENNEIIKNYSTNAFPYNLPVYLQICVIVFLIDEIKIGFTRYGVMQHFVWLLLGITVATMNLIKKEHEKIENNLISGV